MPLETRETHRGVVHVVFVYRQVVWHAEQHRHEERPEDAVDVYHPTKHAVTHIKWPRLEIHLRVVLIYPSSMHIASQSWISKYKNGKYNKMRLTKISAQYTIDQTPWRSSQRSRWQRPD